MRKLMAFFITSLLFSTSMALAESKAGPRGGKLLEHESPRAEVLIQGNGGMSIAFYDDNLKQVPPSTESVAAVVEAPGQKAKLDFERNGDLLVSKGSLPEGDGYTIVIQLKRAPGQKTQNFRIKRNMNICHECGKAEYACICDH